jgi:hypothetical protein
MNKEFVPYEQAISLKELEFDEKCFSFYDSDRELYESEGYYKKGYNVSDEEVIAPLYQQAFRWFREKHNIEGFIVPLISERKGISFEERVYEALIIFKGNKKIKPGFKTYEEAELDCLKKLIEIVKNK